MLRKIVSLGLLQTAGLALNLARSKVFAVLLGPAGVGIVATIDQLVMSVVQVFHLSLPFAALKHLSHAHSLGEAAFRRSYAALWRALLATAALTGIAALLLVPRALDTFASELGGHRQAVLIALAGIVPTMVLMFLTNVLAASGRSTASVSIAVVWSAVALAAGGAGCVWAGVWGIYALAVPATGALAVATLLVLRHAMGLALWGPAGVGIARPRGLVATMAYVHVAVATAGAQLLLARYAILEAAGAQAAGLLQACLAVSLTVGAVLGPASTLDFSPYVNRAIAAHEKMRAADQLLPRLVFLFTLVAVPVLAFPETVLRILFSADFAPAAAVLPWFVAWQCLYQASNVYQQLLIGLDDVRGYGTATAAGNVVAAALGLALAPRFELAGVAAAFAAGAILTAALTVWRLRRRHGLSVPRIGWTISAFALAAFALMGQADAIVGETTWTGAAVRFAMAAAVVLGSWALLPEAVRREAAAGAAAGKASGRGDGS